jgi:hypothetical protein
LHSHKRKFFEIEAPVFSGIFKTLLDIENFKDISASVGHENLSQAIGKLCRYDQREASIVLELE